MAVSNGSQQSMLNNLQFEPARDVAKNNIARCGLGGDFIGLKAFKILNLFFNGVRTQVKTLFPS